MSALLLAALAVGLPVSPLAKDRDLFAPAVTPTAAAPRPPSKEAQAAAIAVKKSQDLAEDLKEYKAAVQRKKRESEAPPASASAAKAAPAKAEKAKPAPTAAPAPVLSKQRLERLEKAAHLFDHAAHQLNKKVAPEKEVEKHVPTFKEKEEAKIKEMHNELAEQQKEMKEESKKRVANFHNTLKGRVNDIKTAAADALSDKHRAKRAAASSAAKAARKANDAKQASDAAKAAKAAKHSSREEMMKVVEAGWARDAAANKGK
jgi:hypothetical protein